MWAGLWTWIICKILEHTTGFRVSAEQEAEGLDESLHGETSRVLDLSPNAVSPSKAPVAGGEEPAKLGLDDKPAEKAEASA